MKSADMRKIRQILLCRYEFGVPQMPIAETFGACTGVVSNLLLRARSAGLSRPLPDDLDDAALHAPLRPARRRLPSDRYEPNWAGRLVHGRRGSRAICSGGST